ncbi:glutathione S-transferase C-terminal domain-containing protein [Streptomyces sp. NPDC046831]|uniref:glutathione S-transferase C-terminal domain-containing protein n=1 Tax=Streptomyces sp. NPDC046831 TaxID=3154805 RepID=UPI00341135EB
MPTPLPTAAQSFRARIGGDARSGYPAVPHRYRLHLALSCPRGLEIAVAHGLLGLGDTVAVTLLPAVPDAPDGGYLALRPLYEASCHRHPGPAAGPVLSDDWTGRVVSTCTHEIIGDLARRFGDHGADLYPHGARDAVEDVRRLCEKDIDAAAQRAGRTDADRATREAALNTLLRALDSVERRLSWQEYVLGDRLTLADVHLWVSLVQLDTVHRWHLDAAAVHRVTGHPRLWSYARRLREHPAFGSRLDLDGIVLRHHAHCRGREAAGAAVPILDWTAEAAVREPVRQGE